MSYDLETWHGTSGTMVYKVKHELVMRKPVFRTASPMKSMFFFMTRLIHDDHGLTLIYFIARSNFVANEFIRGNCYIFSETTWPITAKFIQDFASPPPPPPLHPPFQWRLHMQFGCDWHPLSNWPFDVSFPPFKCIDQIGPCCKIRMVNPGSSFIQIL